MVRHTDIVTYRLSLPRGRFSKNPILVCTYSIYLDNPDTGVSDIQSTVHGDVRGVQQGQVPSITPQVGNILLYILNHGNGTKQSPNSFILTEHR